MNNSQKIDRRCFLKGGAAVGGLMALGALAGCAPSQNAKSVDNSTWMPASWDAEADLVAIGAGGAGLAAAIEGRDLGLSVIVLESQNMVGGNSAICNGGMAIPGSALQKELGIEDSPDIMFEDMCAWFKDDYDEAYVRLLCDQQALLYDWLTGLGVEFRAESVLATNGHSRPREHHLTPGTTVSTLLDAAETRGADIRLKSKVIRLVQDPDSKRVLGVVLEDGSAIKAQKGVVLASGGYARNTDMLNHYVFGTDAQAYENSTYDAMGQDGSGILMAMNVGADTRHMDYLSMLTVQNPEGSTGDACAIYHLGAVLVNKEGERFVNEAQGYTNVWSETNLQTDKMCYQVWDQNIFDAYQENDSSYYSMEKVVNTGLLLTADTYEDLANQMGVPVDAFVATMNRYNSDIEQNGVDSVMGRAHLNNDGPAPLVLNHPPYYAFATTNVICCTYGGVKQDASAGCLAVDVFGNTIPSLYLAGNVSGYSNMGIVPGTRIARNASGTGFGGALAFGRYTAQQISQLENWDM